jgi:hypothetical protein
MNHKYYYAYAFTWSDHPLNDCGDGVDSRYEIEPVCCGEVAAVASRVGFDRFDPSKLEQGTADLPWLSEVAVAHNRIVCAIAQCGALLPLRLGTLFESRSSLESKVVQCKDRVAAFLEGLGDRREWAVKTYLDEDLAEQAWSDSRPDGRNSQPQPDATQAPAGVGTQYLVARRQQVERRRQIHAAAQRQISILEGRLQSLADCWCRLPPLSAALTGRPEKMIGNAAFLLQGCVQHPFQTACERLRDESAPQGLILEVSGPWPPYHFCPALDQ